MPPRTRQAQKAQESQPTKGNQNKNLLKHTASQNLVHGDDAMGRDIGNVTQSQTNLTGRHTASKSGITNIIISNWEMYLIYP
jgi:hypothetical protein